MILALLALSQLAGASPRPLDTITVASSRGVRRIAVALDHGFPAVAAPPLGSVLSIEAPEATTGMFALRVNGRQFIFTLDAAFFRFAGNVYTLAAGPYVARDTLFLPLQFLAEHLPRLDAHYRWNGSRGRLEELSDVVTAMAPPSVAPAPASAPVASAPARPAPARRPRLVAIDPGHGGIDHGMSGPLGRSHFLQEKDVTLAIAEALKRELESRGLLAMLTRESDTLIALDDRGRIAAAAGATIFVSIHVNAANPGWRNAAGARGFETYFLAEAKTEDARAVAQMENASVRFETSVRAPRGDPMAFILRDLARNEHLRESSQLAATVQESLGRVHPAESRGVKQAGFWVLSTTYMPAILIETGFGSNDAEARYLTSEAGQQRLARAIADGISAYLADFDRRTSAGAP